jgi:predicted RNase H-like HicB family nuclease
MSEFVVIIHRAEEGGYWAEIPVLPGCYVQGETLDELLAEAPEVIESHLQALREDGQEIPGEEQFVLATVRVPSPSAA